MPGNCSWLPPCDAKLKEGQPWTGAQLRLVEEDLPQNDDSLLPERSTSAACHEDAANGDAKGLLHGYAGAMQAAIANQKLEEHSHRTHTYFVRVAMRAASLSRWSQSSSLSSSSVGYASYLVSFHAICHEDSNGSGRHAPSKEQIQPSTCSSSISSLGVCSAGETA